MVQVKKKSIKQKILSVAREQITVSGYETMSMRKIAAACNVSVGNLYNYFPNKEAILDAIVGDFYHTVMNLEQANIAMPSSLSPTGFEQYLTTFKNDLTEFINKNSDILRILLVNVKGSKYENFKKDFIANFYDFELKSLALLVSKNSLINLPSETLIKNICHMYLNLCETYLVEKKSTQWIDEMIDELNTFILRGLNIMILESCN